MRYLMLSFILFSFCPVVAQFNPAVEKEISNSIGVEIDKENILTGKWQEFQRKTSIKRKGTFIEFTDTLQFRFMPDSTVRMWYPDGRYFTVPYSFEQRKFMLGERFAFSFYEVNESEMHLGNGSLVHYFKRVNKLQQGAIQRKKVGIGERVIKVSPTFFKGKWASYKKEDKQFTNSTYYLSALDIMEDNGNGRYAIKFSESNRTDKKSYEGILLQEGNELKLTADGYDKTFTIIKAADTEMVIESGSQRIFFKNFSK